MTLLGSKKGILSGEAEAKWDKMKNEKDLGRRIALIKPFNVLASTQDTPGAVED